MCLNSTTQFRTFQQLSVVVAEHRPEPAKRPSRNRNAELGDITSQEHRNVVLAPELAVTVIIRQERRRTTSSHPELLNVIETHLPKVESPQEMVPASSGQGFRALLNQGS